MDKKIKEEVPKNDTIVTYFQPPPTCSQIPNNHSSGSFSLQDRDKLYPGASMRNRRPMPNNLTSGLPPHFSTHYKPIQPPMEGSPSDTVSQTDFSGLPEEQSVCSSSPVLKKPKLEANEKSGDKNDQIQIGFEKISSSDDLPVSTDNY